MPAMLPVSVAELASIRADAAAAVCTLPCTIERWNKATQTWPTVSQPGLLVGMTEPTAGQLQNYEYMIGDLAAWHIHFPYGTDVRDLDRLVITEDSGITTTLAVNKVLQPRSYTALISVLATE